ncbi:hypothetical protein Mth01_33410 [Sphaerimonospora thailandensis]|uniref:Uncharacterized protein n=1 Tax=Sphaerimonospora thailandensis TaxID=795644 RepID=A0A8J3W0H1_9ACTN|nr:hypothetical protein Mth01_33410 [Sphaerimonospora thailandensis]
MGGGGGAGGQQDTGDGQGDRLTDLLAHVFLSPRQTHGGGHAAAHPGAWERKGKGSLYASMATALLFGAVDSEITDVSHEYRERNGKRDK